MNNLKEFLDHFNTDFYTEKERVSQYELDAYLDVASDISRRQTDIAQQKMWAFPQFRDNGKFRFDFLSNKNLRGLNFDHRRIPDLIIKNSDLRRADLSCCIFGSFHGTDFTGSDVTDANLRGANLSIAKLDMVRGLPGMACPEEGGFIGWKKAKSDIRNSRDVLIRLYIPARAKRSSATTNKCRASEAFVLDIVDMYTREELERAVSSFDSRFEYRRGKWVRPAYFSFDENRWNECAPGIHFFMDKQSTIEY